MNFKLKIISFCVSTILLLLSSLQARSVQQDDQVTIAVMDFKNNSSVFRYDRLERMVPEMLKTELSHYSEIAVVERSKIESILKEQALAQAGVIETETAQKVGQLVGAEYIITGEINRIGNQLRIDAHLLKVATGQVLGEKVTGRNIQSVEPMVKLLAQNLIFNLTGKGERQDFAKIKQYGTNWAIATTAGLSVVSAVLHFQFKHNYDKYQQNDQLIKFNSYYDDANQYYKARNIMLMVTGAAALTTFILWRKNQGEENKIYASRYKTNSNQRYAIALSISDGKYLVSWGVKF